MPEQGDQALVHPSQLSNGLEGRRTLDSLLSAKQQGTTERRPPSRRPFESTPEPHDRRALGSDPFRLHGQKPAWVMADRENEIPRAEQLCDNRATNGSVVQQQAVLHQRCEGSPQPLLGAPRAGRNILDGRQDGGARLRKVAGSQPLREVWVNVENAAQFRPAERRATLVCESHAWPVGRAFYTINSSRSCPAYAAPWRQ
jgi:hypothetical protein